MYRIGIDLGGTNIVTGVVDENYHIIAKAKCKTDLPRPAEEIADSMAATVREAVAQAGLKMDDIEVLGIGSPGSIDPKKGRVVFSNNFGLRDWNLCAMLEARVGKKFYIENDANAAAYGEFIAGAGRGTENFIAITLGTGVGGGIIIDGKIYSGSNFAGGELGHTVINMGGAPCTCGRHGCWEVYASATALIEQTRQAMNRYPHSLMWKLCENDLSKVSGRTAFDAMRQDDPIGRMVVDHYCEYVAIGVSNFINVFQPEVFCIGGGISHEGETLTKPIRAFVEGENYARFVEDWPMIRTAELGNDAGIIGAAYLCDLYR